MIITQSEIAWLLRELLSETRTYCGARFPCCFPCVDEEIAFYKRLLLALPTFERLAVETSFDKIYSALATIRVEEHHATHHAPEATQ